MKYCTDDFSHFFDSAEECLAFEKTAKVSQVKEEEALLLKINDRLDQLNVLTKQYSIMTRQEIQIRSFDGKAILRQLPKTKSTIEGLRTLF